MQYVPFASDIEIPFYAALASHKINHDRLDDSARKLLGLYEIRPSDRPENSSRMQIHGNALTSDEVPAGYYRAEGMIKNVNTIEDYKGTDKGSMLQQAGRTIWDAINDGTIYSCPSLLTSFVVLSFANLKKYHFYYWFAFPALQSDPPWAPVAESTGSQDANTSIAKPMTSAETSALVEKVQTWRYGVDARQHAFFLAKRNRRLRRESYKDESDSVETRPTTPKTPTERLGFTWQVSSLSGYESGFFEGEYSEDCYVCFADPSNYPQAPGWALRNLLVLIRQRWKRDRVQILCYRDTQQQRDGARSVIYDLELTKKPKKPRTKTEEPTEVGEISVPKVVGWERNEKGKLNGRMADLTEYMDPKKLADQSVDLNLKLMKWRISPNLNLDKIKNTKCLLLGAGTLGSYVARNLLGWGVRKITFVDNGRVSYSNPVRQPLFDFKDCLGGGAKKAVRAAEALKRIYPGVDSTGHELSVPMAGHPITDPAGTKKDFEQLKELVDSHDVVFLLMDTRESRWLPTVMGKAAGKVVMNAALGFDTFVVMRHGVKVENAPDTELGCYFCNDVVAPADSVKDQTLDQQCTVTRPGVAAIASALLVELLVSLLQHPQGPAAPAPMSSTEDRGDHPLGLVPHQIRGFLSTFQNMSIAGKSYNCCSACSDKIADTYRADGWDFVQKALNEKGFVEELSGLAEVQRIAEAASADVEWEEEGEIEEEGEGEMI
ncbi:Ubiquitin-like modifier-activating enzyme ATG7 [Endocarpon pusillum Z07020]|uniref:Ubiquitin-like modifier-activating enzyme ATG7 n=1 Tax=Endocarpon pusillum (strain Z07020 / HMAS-L-300199) TaxID=1263415 RepID=U1HJV0_ENDPU|nr:Ubiquitin-like modifier-activating enzyme ATG7 [Endocarpon pusillum Z07020]ERF70525.1 Ubiquitin-like modifier-activating enzyme ATG7 [Endocarpon pusillum Z07020]